MRNKLIILLVTLLGLVGLSFVTNAPASATTSCSSVTISGHRAHVYAPTSTAEETLHAANYAKAHSASILEMDIWRLASGKWVVNHDPDWSRTIDPSVSTAGGPLSWSTSKNVESTTVAQWNEGPLTKGLNKPAVDLAGLYAWAANNTDVIIWIEMKTLGANSPISAVPQNGALDQIVGNGTGLNDTYPTARINYYGTWGIMTALRDRDRLNHGGTATAFYGVDQTDKPPADPNAGDPQPLSWYNDNVPWAKYIIGSIGDPAPSATFNANAIAAGYGTFSRGLNAYSEYDTARTKNYQVLDFDDTADGATWKAAGCPATGP